ncbi:mediator of RNA polymerase II transcription subunit 7a-like, partial [Magnolia sinica]|uniref:mediator of RNA polymerase II transcription subunit 7a-like n=1 Tax=Magnolia sinica TaxID=86752 RepID=UPI002658ABBC
CPTSRVSWIEGSRVLVRDVATCALKSLHYLAQRSLVLSISAPLLPEGEIEIMAAGATSAFPPPPPYYRLYKDYIQNPKSAPPPPPPINGTYTLYGANYTTDDILPSLEDQGVRQLYPKGPNVDFKKELRSLNRELLLHILELTDVLVERPSQYARRVEDISLIFRNLHHLLNSIRPHQARSTLIHILELQIQRRKQAVEDIKRRREEAQRLLKESLATLDGHMP